VTSPEHPSDLQARIAAGRILSLASGRVSAALDQFSGWLLSGFGVAFALIVANIDAVSKHVTISALQAALGFFLSALGVGVIAKLLSAMVTAGAEAAEQGAAIGRDLAERQVEVDVKRMFQESEKAFFWPVRLLVSAAFRKANTGDFAAAGRMHTKIAQVQSFLVILEVLLAASSVVALGCGLTV
jgi:hypothetical protein